jgi:hypothetical protein
MPESVQRKTKNQVRTRIQASKGLHWLVVILARLIAFPLFIFLHKLLPDPEWILQLDRILLFLGIFGLIEFVFKQFKPFVFAAFAAAICWLLYGSFSGGYGFGHMATDYKVLVFGMLENPHPEKVLFDRLAPFPNRARVTDAIDFDNPEVRNFAITTTTKHFLENQNDPKYMTLIQCFAVFKEINTRWHYVNDPKSREYYAKASESVQHLAGDCDDHSIFMAACLRAVGGVPRLIHTRGHMYPELLIGNRHDLERLNYLIRRQFFREESKGQLIHYHIDTDGRIWLNLDYTARYPGGKFLSEEILGVLQLVE